MLTHFNLVNDIMRRIFKGMLEGLRISIQNDTLGIFPNEKEFNALYPAFEIFAYLLFRLDFLVVMYQEQKLRMPLFNFIADKMLEILDIEKNTFNSTLNKRMEEYAGIQTDRQLTNDLRTKKLVQGFVDNLTYSISKQDFFRWEGKRKPLPLLGINEVLTMHITYKDILLPLEIGFAKMVKNLFKANSDFTQLSVEEINSILESTVKEIENYPD